MNVTNNGETMTTFKTIAEQMRKQGMSQAEIQKWGRMVGQSVTTTTEREPLQPSTAPTRTQADRGSAPSRQVIARYWMNQMVKHRENMAEDQKDEFYSKPSFERKMSRQDWGEPCCWACGWYKNDRADYGVAAMKDPLSSWDKANWLERCHIVPHMLGGSNDASNLVLLCKKCHKAAPDTKRSRHMFRFITKRPHYQDKLLSALSATPGSDMQIVFENQAEFKAYLTENMGVHFGGDRTESMVAMIEDFAEDFRDGLIDPISTVSEEKQ